MRCTLNLCKDFNFNSTVLEGEALMNELDAANVYLSSLIINGFFSDRIFAAAVDRQRKSYDAWNTLLRTYGMFQ